MSCTGIRLHIAFFNLERRGSPAFAGIAFEAGLLQTGNVIAVLGLAALLGGMLFFGAIMAPLVFTKLPSDIAGPFIRAAFPRYYAFVTVSAMVAALGLLLRGQGFSAIALALVAAVTVWAWFWLIPHLNALRETGNMIGFNRGHRLSVWLNGVELITGLVVLVRLALR
jgi:hypothetical protein